MLYRATYLPIEKDKGHNTYIDAGIQYVLNFLLIFIYIDSNRFLLRTCLSYCCTEVNDIQGTLQNIKDNHNYGNIIVKVQCISKANIKQNIISRKQNKLQNRSNFAKPSKFSKVFIPPTWNQYVITVGNDIQDSYIMRLQIYCRRRSVAQLYLCVSNWSVSVSFVNSTMLWELCCSIMHEID